MAGFKKLGLDIWNKRNADQNVVKHLPIIGVNMAPAATFINYVTEPI